MLYIFILFLIYFLTTFLSGKILLKILYYSYKDFKTTLSFPIISILGGVFLTTFLVIISFFSAINLNSQILLTLSIIIIYILWCKLNRNFLKIKITWFNVVASFVFIIFSLFIVHHCYYPSSHYDEGLYYVQNVKWLKEYGTVPGLALLHSRLGFNSNWHTLEAFFDYPQILPDLFFNDINGALLVICLLYSISGFKELLNKQFYISSILKCLFLFPIFIEDSTFFTIDSNIYVNTFAADFSAAVFGWIGMIAFIEAYEKKHDNAELHKLIAVILSSFTFTVKISLLPILMINFFIMVDFILNKNYQSLKKVIIIQACIFLPWMIRNYFLSGYLIFPVVFTGFLNPEWKLDEGSTKWTVTIIREWARETFQKPELTKLSFKEYFIYWFNKHSWINQLLYELAIISCIVGVTINSILFSIKNKATIYLVHFILFLICSTGILFWFFNGPDMRFGATFLIFPILLLFSMLIGFVIKRIWWVYLTLLTAIIIYKTDRIIQFQLTEQAFFSLLTSLPENKRYIEKTESRLLKDGLRIFVPMQGDQCHHSTLPCTPEYEFKNYIKLRQPGNLNKGFKK